MTPVDLITSNKMKVIVVRLECGHQFTAQLQNIMGQVSVCGVCGPQKRMANALQHWLKKYGKCLDYERFEDYRYQVRKLTEQVYKANKQLLNPLDLPRSRPDLLKGCVQLDHVKPIIECFKDGWTPERAAALENLQVLDAIDNLKKQRFV